MTTEIHLPIPAGRPGCDRCEILRKDVTFWREQQKLAADVAAGLADLNDYDGRVADLRKRLRIEAERRRAAELRVASLTYELALATGTEP